MAGHRKWRDLNKKSINRRKGSHSSGVVLGIGIFLVVVFVLALFLLLAGCSKPPNSGYITGKNYTPEHYDDYVDRTCVIYDGKTGFCKQYQTNVRHDYVPPYWEICLKADEHSKDHDDEGCIEVSKETYNNYQVGNHYPEAR